MLKAKLIPQFLDQINTDGVKLNFLMLENGALMASAGTAISEKSKGVTETKIIAAIMSNVWTDYSKFGRFYEAGKLNSVIIDCEEGRIAAMKVGPKHVLAAFGVGIQAGLLKLKLEKMKIALDDTIKALNPESHHKSATAESTQQ